MLWEFFSLSNLINPAEAMRRQHSRWLTKAFQRPSRLPRIPTRLVSDGGFNSLMETPHGRAWAEDWWSQTLQNRELDLEG